MKSSFADYLFYLLWRFTGDYPDLKTAVPIDDIATIDQAISLPEQAASRQVSGYGQIYSLLRQYQTARNRVERVRHERGRHYRILSYSKDLPSYEDLHAIVSKGEKSSSTFERYWQDRIAPAEDKQIEAWKRQMAECKPFDKLQQLTRLSFPFSRLDIGAIALHRSGSGNTDPPGIYTALFERPNLAWVVGHEGAHLTVDHYAGHNWQKHRLATQAIGLVEQHGGSASDIEESLSLFMQIKLSQECGYSKAELRISDSFEASSLKGAVLRSLEARWDAYQSSARKNIIDYLLESTLQAFR